MSEQPDFSNYTAGALKVLIEQAGLSHANCVEKAELRELAIQAHVLLAKALPENNTSPLLPAPEAAPAAESQLQTQPAEPENEPSPLAEQFRDELVEHWSEQALRIQLLGLGLSESTFAELTATGASKEAKVALYFKVLDAQGADSEDDMRWLRISDLDHEAQARKFVEALAAKDIGAETTLQQALRTGELLCDVVNVLLVACGSAAVTVCRDTSAEGQAAESRLRAKQMENISRYQAACLALGVPQSNTFDVEDLYENKNMQVVVGNLHALAQAAHKIGSYRGPHMCPVLRKDKVWQQSSEVIQTDWRMGSSGSSMSNLTLAPSNAPPQPPPPSLPKLESTADLITAIASADSAITPDWRRLFSFIDTDGLDDDEAALRCTCPHDRCAMLLNELFVVPSLVVSVHLLKTHPPLPCVQCPRDKLLLVTSCCQ